jgi:hypothetical protein
MATLNQANTARAEHADDLAKQGAHAIGVEKRDGFGKSGWVVVAYVDPVKAPVLPANLSTMLRGKAVDVPLVIEKAEPFAPQ